MTPNPESAERRTAMEPIVILKTLVGSQAHGLAGPESDYDYRGVFAVPTEDILRLGGNAKRTSWIERGDNGVATNDDTSWEVAHFIHLATKCNPSILEVFAAPIVEANEWGVELRALLPYVWSPQGVRDAFIGYGLNQRKKMLDDKDLRPGKYAYTYLRVLASAVSLLETGSILVDMRGHETYDTLKRMKAWADVTKGEVINACEDWQHRVEIAALACKHEQNLEAVDEFLLRLRAAYWGKHAALSARREDE